MAELIPIDREVVGSSLSNASPVVNIIDGRPPPGTLSQNKKMYEDQPVDI